MELWICCRTLSRGRTAYTGVIPYEQCNGEAGVRLLSLEKQVEFSNVLSGLNSIIENDELLDNEFSKRCREVKNMYSSFLEPHSVSFLHYMRNRGILPAFLSRRKRTLYLNLFRCESHREIIVKLLEEERK